MSHPTCTTSNDVIGVQALTLPTSAMATSTTRRMMRPALWSLAVCSAQVCCVHGCQIKVDYVSNNNNYIERYNSRFLQSSQWAANCPEHVHSSGKALRVQSCAIMCNTSSACHMPHVVCHVIQRLSSAVKFDRVESHLF